jgi:Ca-activated chloride channel homolog
MRIAMKKLVIVIVLFSVVFLANAQNERRFVRQGNRFYLEGLKDTTRLDTASFSKAETEYRRALEKRPHDPNWNFNLSNSQYKQMRFEESAAAFRQLTDQANTPEEKARALHNLGNSLLFQQKIDESIDAYKEALRNNPSDLDTKYNLAYAQMLKNQPQDQQQNQDQNKDQQQDKQDQQQDQNQDQQDQQDQQKQQQPPPKISPQNAEQLLQALQNAERDIQDKVKKQQAREAKPTRVEKDW